MHKIYVSDVLKEVYCAYCCIHSKNWQPQSIGLYARTRKRHLAHKAVHMYYVQSSNGRVSIRKYIHNYCTMVLVFEVSL